MAEIVNLRVKRKVAARVAARNLGDENAMKSGRTKAQKRLEQVQAAKARAELDGKKLQTP